MLKSPFKFLDSYTLEDRAIFFGRDQEKMKVVIGTNLPSESIFVLHVLKTILHEKM